jgi:hypothetical protein
LEQTVEPGETPASEPSQAASGKGGRGGRGGRGGKGGNKPKKPHAQPGTDQGNRRSTRRPGKPCEFYSNSLPPCFALLNTTATSIGRVLIAKRQHWSGFLGLVGTCHRSHNIMVRMLLDRVILK